MVILAFQGFSKFVGDAACESVCTLTVCKLCQIVTFAMSQSMYFSSLDMREAYFSILVDGPLQLFCEPLYSFHQSLGVTQ